ncbi:hypothetical protein CfE428DRAFT_1029 [Chthoniobacter flavus Ellin428]|uniref:Uncharacterized protein n=1 Tax=Chthoniobacter flavus Ellin428 TaxID=497964 RepID=B4CWJ1_9BACT|nr:prepilin-type N-terminal cleavage/methylation domain-containing protein [Chthoniobacter flavus]EDY21783.1 hypothetical protein CfE428DRAFT_1029 [Chthoniobacter flavus Ellin428]TCO95713.1 hypothetical protein EV701_101404 [Chthoniobacter flavus]
MQITAPKPTVPPGRPFFQTCHTLKWGTRNSTSREGGVTLVETLISLVVIVIGLAGLFTTAAQSFRLLRRSKELVTVRECMLTRIDSIRALSFTEVARPVLPAGSTTASGSLSTSVMNTDPNSFGGSLTAMKNFKETVNVYALGGQIFSNDTQRQSATPDYQYEYASQIDSAAPAAPKTYKSNSQTPGDWTLQVANALPYYQITRVGIGASAVVTVDTTGCANTLSPNDLSGYPALLIDITYSWTDSSNITRTQVGSMIQSKNGSLQ